MTPPREPFFAPTIFDGEPPFTYIRPTQPVRFAVDTRNVAATPTRIVVRATEPRS